MSVGIMHQSFVTTKITGITAVRGQVAEVLLFVPLAGITAVRVK